MRPSHTCKYCKKSVRKKDKYVIWERGRWWTLSAMAQEKLPRIHKKCFEEQHATK